MSIRGVLVHASIPATGQPRFAVAMRVVVREAQRSTHIERIERFSPEPDGSEAVGHTRSCFLASAPRGEIGLSDLLRLRDYGTNDQDHDRDGIHDNESTRQVTPEPLANVEGGTPNGDPTEHKDRNDEDADLRVPQRDDPHET